MCAGQETIEGGIDGIVGVEARVTLVVDVEVIDIGVAVVVVEG